MGQNPFEKRKIFSFLKMGRTKGYGYENEAYDGDKNQNK
jgi:hypothetical protein